MPQETTQRAKQLATTPDRKELAARVRAALAYAGLTRHDVAEQCEALTEAKIRRTLDAMRDTTALELAQLSVLCNVPMSWFERGEWSVDAHASRDEAPLVFGQGATEDRLRVVEHYLTLLLRESMLRSPAELLLPHDASGFDDPDDLAAARARR